MKTNYRMSHQSERVSEIYDEVLYRPGMYDDALWQEEKRVLQRELSRLERDVAKISYLDFACGTGRLLSFLEDHVNEATGVDIAEEMLRRARKIVHRARVIRADSTREDPLAGEVFDFITAFRFFLNAEPALREEAMAVLAGKLRDGRSELVFNIHGNLWSHRIITKVWLMTRAKRLSASTKREMEQLANRHGLYVARWYGIGILPKVLYRLFGSSCMRKIDGALSRLPGARSIAYDLIFVCKKKNSPR